MSHFIIVYTFVFGISLCEYSNNVWNLLALRSMPAIATVVLTIDAYSIQQVSGKGVMTQVEETKLKEGTFRVKRGK